MTMALYVYHTCIYKFKNFEYTYKLHGIDSHRTKTLVTLLKVNEPFSNAKVIMSVYIQKEYPICDLRVTG